MSSPVSTILETSAPAPLSLDQAIDEFFSPVATAISDAVFWAVPLPGGNEFPLILAWLLVAGVFFTVYLGFQQIRPASIRHSSHVMRGHFSRHTDPGDVTSFQALATELSGTVGLGNIAGVAIAISTGGPGASFWIAVAGLVGMSVKMSEATLGVKFRVINEDGTISGGPMYYLRDGLASIGKPKLGRVLATIFAICTAFGVIGAGNMFQSNQAAYQLAMFVGGKDSWIGTHMWVVGLVFAVLVGIVIVGGASKIGAATSKIVPFMGILYTIMCLAVIGANITEVGAAFTSIWSGAFTGQGITGGVLGVLIVGVQRAAFSNAAGVGTAGIAHSAVKTRRPAQEGFVAMWEPFIDSVVICTMTAITIIITGVYKAPDADGVQMTARALRTVAPWFSSLLTLAVLLFAFSTMLSYSFYGKKAVGFLFGNSATAEHIYNAIFLILLVVGAATNMTSILGLADAMLFLMAVPNVLGMYFLARVVAREIKGHRERLDAGVIPQVPKEAQAGMMVANEATPEQLKTADQEYALRAAAMDARSDKLNLGHTAPDTERDYLEHLPEDHELFDTMDREGKPLKD
ncbi:sodium:alanine symporter family protein [Cutibacterium sp.]|uniref:alanine/glycine:cation symporter family protein n=1 Tax=Cutibacterium sp. TaxID=1912221 RepID=UPI0026DD53DD|nr:alanine/glycine:cation symporter family protein [Cutibacterium sp.]MDO4413177.1 alanine/glycine:cation symporter family protein [Cutibacterium sp.]